MDEMRERFSVLDAPSNLGLRPPHGGREPGVRRMAAALRATGLLARLGAEDAGDKSGSYSSPERPLAELLKLSASERIDIAPPRGQVSYPLSPRKAPMVGQ